jgi:ATP-dependent DNA helicase RecG
MISQCKAHLLPEPDFKEEMGGFSVVFYKEIYTESNLKKLGLNERMTKAIMYLKENGLITNKIYQNLNNCARNTASHELKELVEKNFLIESGKKGVGAYYIIAQ